MGLTQSSDSLEDALIDAIKEKKVSKVRSILKKGVKVNYKDDMGFTPLMHSAILGLDDITIMLLRAGSNIADINYRGLDALALAKFNGCTSVYKILIEAQADQFIVNESRLIGARIVDGCRYNYLDIIRREIYCENDRAKDLANDVLDIIERYKDDRVELIMHCIALHTMETDWTGNNLQIFVTDNIDVSVFKGDNVSLTYLLGIYNKEKNIIQISSFGGKFNAAQTFLHELVHKVHLACCHLKLKELDVAYKNVKRRLEESDMNEGRDYIKRNMLFRISSILDYKKSSLKTFEYLADSIAYILICNKKKDDINFNCTIQHVLEPIYQVFDKYIVPQLMEYVIHNKNFHRLLLSDSMKAKFRVHENRLHRPKVYVFGAKNISRENGKQLK